MKIASNDSELEKYLQDAAEISPEHPVVISKFILDAREVEVDAVCDGENTFIGTFMEHIENAGIHSGDATICIPTISIPESMKEGIEEQTRKIACELKIVGPFNIQYLIRKNELMVIECNLRASRSMPFVSKTTGRNLMELAADAIVGKKIPNSEGVPQNFAVKSPQFSFSRLTGVDPIVGVEMASTGEVACFGKNFEEAFAKSIEASGIKPLKKGDNILLLGNFNSDMLKNFTIVSDEHQKFPIIEKMIQDKKIELCISLDASNGRELRRKCADFSVPIINNVKLAKRFLAAFENYRNEATEFLIENPNRGR